MSEKIVMFEIEKPGPTLQDSVVTRYIVAVLGAWCAEFVTYPFDLTKTRLQIQNEVASRKHGFKVFLGQNMKMENRGTILTVIDIAKNEGPMKLWSGLLPMCQRHVIYAGSRLIFYERMRKLFVDEAGRMPLGYTMLCAVPNMQRAAMVNIGDLAAYDYAKRLLMQKFEMSDSTLLHTLAACIAGLVAAVMGTPADFLKTRVMNQPVGPDGKGILYKGSVDCLRQSVMNEGILSIYKGFVPMWVRLGPWALVNWVAFEKIMSFIGGKSF